MADDSMTKVIRGLAVQLGRLPTEDEVIWFIFGDDQQRKDVLNGAVPSSGGRP